MMDFLTRHAGPVTFTWVFLDQLGVPIPAVPLLLGIGALIGVGALGFGPILAVAIVASMLADLAWFAMGRWRGRQVLGWLCRISLEPDSCVRRTETMFMSRGLQALPLAKFVPGLNTVASALAGTADIGLTRFLPYAAVGGLVWAGWWTALGYLFSEAIEGLVATAGHVGVTAAKLLALVLGAYIVAKSIQRHLFVRQLRIARISPEELKRRLDAGDDVRIIDLRTVLDVTTAPYTIPGALRLAPDDLERRRHELPNDREIVLYCT